MSFKSSIVLAALGLFLANACIAPDCNNKDFGSCGNACCKLSFEVAAADDKIASVFNETLAGGGPDSRFFESTLAEGVRNVADLRPYGVGVSFIGQTIHTTAKRIYNDTINFTIFKKNESAATVNVFSISQIGGAYGDDGQNFKNIAVLMKDVYAKLNLEFSYTHADSSCPEPATVTM
eukprot:jgi/Bigna1/90382/estExt_fgenesh1_pg.C_690017